MGCVFFANAQTTLTISPPEVSDSMQVDSNHLDSILNQQYVDLANERSSWLQSEKDHLADVQQVMQPRKNIGIVIILLIGLSAITYLKIAFGKQLEELFQSLINFNIAQQIFRTKSEELTMSSIILHANFIIVSALFAYFILTGEAQQSNSQYYSAIAFLIFLFTLFYLAKIFLLKFIGIVFELKNETDEYIFHFTTISKTLGLTLFPALFVLVFAPKHFIKVVMILSAIIFAAFFFLLLLRGLSTAGKILYRNIYHFIVYVCVVEVSMMFLLFKLLTKTIN